MWDGLHILLQLSDNKPHTHPISFLLNKMCLLSPPPPPTTTPTLKKSPWLQIFAPLIMYTVYTNVCVCVNAKVNHNSHLIEISSVAWCLSIHHHLFQPQSKWSYWMTAIWPIHCPFHPVLQWHVKDPGHSAKSAGGRLHQHPWPNEVEVGWLCCCPGIVWEPQPITNQAHAQLIREHSVTIISARWANVDWSWPKEWN